MTPTWQTADGSIRLWLADCLDVLRLVTKQIAIVTDPPYGMANNPDASRFMGGLERRTVQNLQPARTLSESRATMSNSIRRRG